ncbi:MAG: gas vesicle protein [Ignavibacteriales bacterium CG07_land_8_20_14_0_80_59_12]|nr:MAG: gas vesicle protein [Ignavibacteriales bacterium CG07_land_8_20_14_0_80_59_12]
MEKDKSNLARGLIIGFIAGSVVGAVTALLYAPKSGKELRADIKTKGGDLLNDAERYLAHAQEKAADIINEGKSRSEELITQARQKAETILHDAEKILTTAKEKTAQISEETGKIKGAVKAGIDTFKSERGRS